MTGMTRVNSGKPILLIAIPCGLGLTLPTPYTALRHLNFYWTLPA